MSALNEHNHQLELADKLQTHSPYSPYKLYTIKIIDVMPFTYSDYKEILDMYNVDMSNGELSILLEKLGFYNDIPTTKLITMNPDTINSIYTPTEIKTINITKIQTQLLINPENKIMMLDEFNEFMQATFTHSCITEFIIKINIISRYDMKKYIYKYIKARRILTKSKLLNTVEYADFINIDNKWHYINGKTVRLISENKNENGKTREYKTCISCIKKYYLLSQFDDDENTVFEYGHYEL